MERKPDDPTNTPQTSENRVSLLDEIAAITPATPRHAPAVIPPPLVGQCTNARHPTLQGRVLVRWQDPSGTIEERWMPTLQGLVVREGDRVLLMHAGNYPEPLVMGVVDGFARRPEPERAGGPSIELARDESLRITTKDGEPLLEVHPSLNGPVVRLLKSDVELELPGRLRLSAAAIELDAREGNVAIKAHDDVVVEGEIIHLN